MPCIVLCTDGPDSSEQREKSLQAHFKFIENHLDRIAVAGPLKPDPEADSYGSLFIYHTDDQEEALAFTRDDPYFKAGVWAEIRALHFTPAAGSYVGGKTW
jgi:uncharacterized protein YciI